MHVDCLLSFSSCFVLIALFNFVLYRISLLHSNAKVGQSKGDLLSELSKLEAKVDFFNARYTLEIAA